MENKPFLLEKSLEIPKSENQPEPDSASAVCSGDTYCRTPPVADDAQSD
ncbi:MAG: hypothetical protein QY304_00830 [Candidatus Paceibacterota bacterium]|nr:MAG: hypothetical protein QY304_00830 [Candidatus Paceibacterota bacterium]